jgi:hypothetical protein
MKILEGPEADNVIGLGSGRNTQVRKGLMQLKVGQVLIIEKGKDWVTKLPPYRTIRNFAKTSGRKFEYGRTVDGVGWFARRLPD